MTESPSYGVVQLVFEEKGNNYLIYRLVFNEPALNIEKTKWTEAQAELTALVNKFSAYVDQQDFINQWDSHSTITASFECFKFFYETKIKSSLKHLDSKYNYEKFKDLAQGWKALNQIMENEFTAFWTKVQYGNSVKEHFSSFLNVFKSKSISFNKSIERRLTLYHEFYKVYSKEVILLSKVYVNDWKTENFDVVFSFEDLVEGDLSIFLYHEVYRALRTDVVQESKAQIKDLDAKCCAVFNFMKDAPVYKFLCRLDDLFVNYHTISLNRFAFEQFSSVLLLNFIEKFKNAERTISAKLINCKELCFKFYNPSNKNIISQEDFTWLVICEVLALNTAELISLKEKEVWEAKVETICKQIEWRLQRDSLDTIIKQTSVKIIPWKTLQVLNPSFAESFWSNWKKQFYKKNHPFGTLSADGTVVTGKKYKDNDGSYDEAVCVYLAGIYFEHCPLDKKCSIDREVMTIQQRGFTVTAGTKVTMGVQLSFLIDTCILNSKHKKQFSM